MNFKIFFLFFLFTNCTNEPDINLSPKKFSGRRGKFEAAFKGKSLQLELDDGSQFCISYQNEGCRIWSLTSSSFFLDKVCFIETSSTRDFFILDLICDEKRDGVEEACLPTSENTDSIKSLGHIGRLYSKSELYPSVLEFDGESVNETDPPNIITISVKDNPEYCNPK